MIYIDSAELIYFYTLLYGWSCMQLSSTAFKRERDTGRKLAENCASFYTPCL